jgi:hypothetical protein
MPIDWGNRETIFRLLAAAFAVIGKEGVSTVMPFLLFMDSMTNAPLPSGMVAPRHLPLFTSIRRQVN